VKLTFPGFATLEGGPQHGKGFRWRVAGLQEAGVLANHFVAEVAGGLYKGLVHIFDGTVEVGDDDVLSALLYRLYQVPQLLFGPFAGGDVVAHPQHPNQIAVDIKHGHFGGFEQFLMAVNGKGCQLFPGVRYAGTHYLVINAAKFVGQRGRRNIVIRLANDIFGPASDQFAHAWITGHIDARLVLQPDQVRDRFKQGFKQLALMLNTALQRFTSHAVGKDQADGGGGQGKNQQHRNTDRGQHRPGGFPGQGEHGGEHHQMYHQAATVEFFKGNVGQSLAPPVAPGHADGAGGGDHIKASQGVGAAFKQTECASNNHGGDGG